MVSCFITALYDPLLHCHRATFFFFLRKAPHVTLQQRRDFIFPLILKEQEEEEEGEEGEEGERENESEFVHALFATR